MCLRSFVLNRFCVKIPVFLFYFIFFVFTGAYYGTTGSFFIFDPPKYQLVLDSLSYIRKDTVETHTHTSLCSESKETFFIPVS